MESSEEKGSETHFQVHMQWKHPVITLAASLIQIQFSLNRKIWEDDIFFMLWGKKENHPLHTHLKAISMFIPEAEHTL